MDQIIDEAIQELFVAITARWRKDDGTLAIGMSKTKLLEAGGIKPEVLEDLLKKIKEKASGLGIEIVEYLYEGDVWYAVRSSYVCASELKSEEEALLGIIIACVESSEGGKTTFEFLRKKTSNYFSEYQLERILKQLEILGYVQRKKQFLQYSPRIFIEFSEEMRKHIMEESKRLIF